MPRKKTTEQFIERSKKKYGNQFDYSLCIYKNSKEPVTLRCSNQHIFQICPSSHLSKISKGGCMECYSVNRGALNIKYNHETYIKCVSELYKNQYDYSKTVYVNLKTPITITCRIHGDFIQSPVGHLHLRHGCTKCGIIKTANSRMLTEDKIEAKLNKFRLIHNHYYQYGKIFRENSVLWLEIICPKHGSHITRFFNHEKGHGCPKCTSVSSNVQIEWMQYRSIRDGFIQHIKNKGEYIIPGTKLCVDGYQADTNTIYEFQGDYWHGNPDVYDLTMINKTCNVPFGELYFNTLEKINLLKDKGYSVVEIWERDWTRAVKAVIKLQRIWRRRHG